MKWTNILTDSVIAALSLTTACSNSEVGDDVRQYDLHAAYYLGDPDAENAEEQTVVIEEVFRDAGLDNSKVMVASGVDEVKDKLHIMVDQIREAFSGSPVEISTWITLLATEKTTDGVAVGDQDRPVREPVFYNFTSKYGIEDNGEVKSYDICRSLVYGYWYPMKFVHSLSLKSRLQFLCLTCDLNHCTGSDTQLYLYMGGDTDNAEDAITDVIAVYTDDESHPASLQVEGRNYQPAFEKNLNEGTAGKHVWLYTTKDDSGRRLKNDGRVLVSAPDGDAAPEFFEANSYLSKETYLDKECVVMVYDISGKLIGEANFNNGNANASIVKLILVYQKTV